MWNNPKMRRPLGICIAALALACSCNQPTSASTAQSDPNNDPELQRALRLQEALQTGLRPDAAVVDRIERSLAENHCVGALRRWSRKYSYALEHSRGAVDTNTVLFTLREVGPESREGRAVVSPGAMFSSVDDRRHRFAAGSYDIRSSSLTVDFCGQNA